MTEVCNSLSLDKRKLNIFLDCTMLKLGLNYANLGTRYFREIVKLAYFNNTIDLNYKELCTMLSEQLNVSVKKIDSNIYTSIGTININLATKNFKDIFDVDFDYFYISPKKLIILFINVINNLEEFTD